jgi:hypothetical protein
MHGESPGLHASSAAKRYGGARLLDDRRYRGHRNLRALPITSNCSPRYRLDPLADHERRNPRAEPQYNKGAPT